MSNITYSDKIDTVITTINSIKTLLSAFPSYKVVSKNYDDLLKIKEYPFITMKVDSIIPDSVRELGDLEVNLYILVVNKVLSETDNLTDIKNALSIFEDNTLGKTCKGAEITSIDSFIDTVGNSKTCIYEIGVNFCV